jgi:hypothetical protein
VFFTRGETKTSVEKLTSKKTGSKIVSELGINLTNE